MLNSLLNWWKERQCARGETLLFERRVVVAPEETGVRVVLPSGARQTISWAEVNCVAIETNDFGPWGADVWWLLEGTNGRVAYPQGATGDEQMLEELPRRFPTFSQKAVMRAMGCTDNARFVCWERTERLQQLAQADTASRRGLTHA